MGLPRNCPTTLQQSMKRMENAMLRRFIPALIATATTLATATALAAPEDGKVIGQSNMFGKGNPFSIEDLPPGRTRARLKSLPEPARRRAMKWLHGFAFPAKDLESIVIDDEGGIFYVDPAPIEPAAEGEQAPAADGASPEPAASAAEDAFLLHSRPGAPNVVYLDFDGHTFSGTAWSSGTIQARAYDLDGSPSTFNDAERNAIAEIWHRVAEDLSGFDIDVTTEEPASFGPYTGRVLITSKIDASGGAMPYNSGGGVAYVGVWGGSNYVYYSPALVYYDNLSRGTTYIAEASAHEFGHNLGLSHDGTSSVTYYGGHGSGETSWAPIMGNSYYNNVTQWSKGEYAGANNTQDDIAIIASKLYWIGDDHGDTLNDATPLRVESSGEILVSNPELDPHNIYPENKGVIETADDQDLFYFSAAAGQVDLSVTPAWDAFYRTSKRGANLDIQASLLNADGAMLATSDTYATISASVPDGIYYLAVSGVGNGNYSEYASTGEYFISGSVTPGDVVAMPPAANFNSVCTSLICNFSDSSSDSDGSVMAWAWDFGDGDTSAAQSPSHTYASAGTYSVGLMVTDDDGLTASVSKSVTASAPNVPPTAGFEFTCSGLACNFSDGSSDSDGSIAIWSWDFGDGKGATAQNPGHTYASAGTYSVTLSVTDNDGASATTTQSVTVTDIVDNEPPVVTITSPGDGTDASDSVDASGSVTLSATATDTQQISQINLYAGGELRCSGTSSASCKWNLRKVPSGTYIFRAEATDAAGNRSSKSLTINVSSITKVNRGKK
jgi:PKD repeat protein